MAGVDQQSDIYLRSPSENRSIVFELRDECHTSAWVTTAVNFSWQLKDFSRMKLSS